MPKGYEDMSTAREKIAFALGYAAAVECAVDALTKAAADLAREQLELARQAIQGEGGR